MPAFLKCPIKGVFGRTLIKREPDTKTSPKSGALTYLCHEQDYRTAAPAVVCPQKGDGQTESTTE